MAAVVLSPLSRAEPKPCEMEKFGPLPTNSTMPPNPVRTELGKYEKTPAKIFKQVKGSKCINNLWVPPPKDVICNGQGHLYGLKGHLKRRGSNKSLLECMGSCQDRFKCIIVQFQQNKFCDLWGRLPNRTTDQTPGRWYETMCFCNVTERERWDESY
ncbi:hypothetical protein FLONG3_6794 [Fusarium longipes]|uniref:Apple domain-containing protein n=1 Tax=Fusarium longipes TaxID=694270 RepID=A0A395SJ09_9HYPO|nr:hypothetical protein FLONG3_6794 [Fusarium longipes]